MCSQIESRYESVDVEAWMNEYETGGYDFNDQVIRDLCKSKGWTLVTDDGDFDAQGISVLTAKCASTALKHMNKDSTLE